MNQARKKNDLSTIIIVALLLMADAVCNEILSAFLPCPSLCLTLPTSGRERERERNIIYMSNFPFLIIIHGNASMKYEITYLLMLVQLYNRLIFLLCHDYISLYSCSFLL
jgi:hypothetical protein